MVCVGFIFSLVAHSVGFSPLSSLLCLFPIIPFTLAPPCLFVHLVWYFLLMCFDATHLPLSVSTFDSLPDNDFPPIPLSIYIKSRFILQPPARPPPWPHPAYSTSHVHCSPNPREDWDGRPQQQDSEDHRLWPGSGVASYHQDERRRHLRLDGPWSHPLLYVLQG